MAVNNPGGAGGLSGLAASQPYVVDSPDFHGAKHDGVTDDTAAFKAAVSNALTTCRNNGSFYCEIWLSTGNYFLSGANTLDVSQKGRALVALPWYDATIPVSSGGGQDQKTCIVFRSVGRGPGDASAHWLQTNPQIAGTTISSNLNQAFDATFGSCAVIGTANITQVTSQPAFSNLYVGWDGIMMQASTNTNICHLLDLELAANCNIGRAGFAGSYHSAAAAPANQNLLGLYMPFYGNNDMCEADSVTCEGLGIGVIPNEHSHFRALRTIACFSGLYPISTLDSIAIEYWSSEQCFNHLDGAGIGSTASQYPKISVTQMDIEDSNSNTHVLSDTNNRIYGRINYQYTNTNTIIGGAVPIAGCTNLKLYNRACALGPTGSFTNPTVPASTTALRNPFDRDCYVNVAGGTVSAITVTPMGPLNSPLTMPTSGTFMVPSGGLITLTYTVAPTWSWSIL